MGLGESGDQVFAIDHRNPLFSGSHEGDRALITGITGQDGFYLALWLLSLGYEVHGLVRRTSLPTWGRLAGIPALLSKVVLHHGDLLDQGSLDRVVAEVQPDEVYNLAAQSYVGISWLEPELTSQVTGIGALHVLEAVRKCAPSARVYQASSSEMFGRSDGPLNEDSPMYPCSPYGVAKLYAHQMAAVYRESHDMFVACGILFNHESPLRGPEFVTRKICSTMARMALDDATILELATLDPKRDWGFAGDYVQAMWAMLQLQTAKDLVVGTGECHSVRDLVCTAATVAGVEDWESRTRVDASLSRPNEVWHLVCDPTQARDALGWKPTVSFTALVGMMVQADRDILEAASHGRRHAREGVGVHNVPVCS